MVTFYKQFPGQTETEQVDLPETEQSRALASGWSLTKPAQQPTQSSTQPPTPAALPEIQPMEQQPTNEIDNSLSQQIQGDNDFYKAQYDTVIGQLDSLKQTNDAQTTSLITSLSFCSLLMVTLTEELLLELLEDSAFPPVAVTV